MTHGYERISDIMSGLTRVSGEMYAEALYMTRVAREGYVLIGGKFPHPQTTTPGGISSTIDRSDMNIYMLRVVKFFDYARKAAAVWDDLVNFFYEANPRYREVGARPATMIDFGAFDDPWAYDALYENVSAWGENRWCTPGALVDGRLATTDLQRLQGGIEESVDRSFYENWGGGGGGDQSLSQNHPWNKADDPRAHVGERGEVLVVHHGHLGPADRWNAAATRAVDHRPREQDAAPAVLRADRLWHEDVDSSGLAACHGARVDDPAVLGRL